MPPGSDVNAVVARPPGGSGQSRDVSAGPVDVPPVTYPIALEASRPICAVEQLQTKRNTVIDGAEAGWIGHIEHQLPNRMGESSVAQAGQARWYWAMRANSSGSRLAPPTSAPSMSLSAMRSVMLSV